MKLSISSDRIACFAWKRGLDPQLCSAAGMLHDIWNDQVGNCPEHGQLGAIEAEKILSSPGSFSTDEIRVVGKAIRKVLFELGIQDV